MTNLKGLDTMKSGSFITKYDAWGFEEDIKIFFRILGVVGGKGEFKTFAISSGGINNKCNKMKIYGDIKSAFELFHEGYRVHIPRAKK